MRVVGGGAATLYTCCVWNPPGRTAALTAAQPALARDLIHVVLESIDSSVTRTCDVTLPDTIASRLPHAFYRQEPDEYVHGIRLYTRRRVSVSLLLSFLICFVRFPILARGIFRALFHVGAYADDRLRDSDHANGFQRATADGLRGANCVNGFQCAAADCADGFRGGGCADGFRRQQRASGSASRSTSSAVADYHNGAREARARRLRRGHRTAPGIERRSRHRGPAV